MRTGTAEQLRWLDQTTINGDLHVGLRLMERASRGMTDVALEYLERPAERTAVVFCGPGNNGGDGVACARMLRETGVSVRALLVGDRSKMTPDTSANETRLNTCGVTLEDFDPASAEQREVTGQADLLVDAVFGIGLHRPLNETAAAAVRWMNESPAPVLAADIPSGVEANTGRILGCAVRADVTVTFTLPKPGHCVGDGGLCTGRLVVRDIGLDPALVDSLDYPVTMLDEETVRAMLPRRPRDAHKGMFGRMMVLGGCKRYIGAPMMAAQAATRSGVGLVHVAVPEAIYSVTAVKCMEEMPMALPDTAAGALSAGAAELVLERLAEMQAALVGPGLGKEPETQAAVRRILAGSDCPMVLDADGINAVAGHIDVLDSRKAPTILTPHDGEFKTLSGQWPGEDRLGTALAFAGAHRCVLVLKGHRTVVAGPDGRAYLNTTGNDGMAKGGSGDVLGGLMTGLLAQGMPPLEAAAAAVWIHGAAGDMMAERCGRRGMTTVGVMREALPAVLKNLE